jgi:RimJ/RimL family protein N-acetyltransferase
MEAQPAALWLRSRFADVQTAQLNLRCPQAGDSAGVYRVEGDPATNRYNPDGPDRDLAASARRVAEWMREWATVGLGYWVVRLLADDLDPTIIGVGGLRYLPWRDRNILNLYYRFTPAAWGHGYATEMAREAVRLARDYLPEAPIVARIRRQNAPSLAVAVRAGLIHQHDLDTAEHLYYALGWANEGAKESRP